MAPVCMCSVTPCPVTLMILRDFSSASNKRANLSVRNLGQGLGLACYIAPLQGTDWHEMRQGASSTALCTMHCVPGWSRQQAALCLLPALLRDVHSHVPMIARPASALPEQPGSPVKSCCWAKISKLPKKHPELASTQVRDLADTSGVADPMHVSTSSGSGPCLPSSARQLLPEPSPPRLPSERSQSGNGRETAWRSPSEPSIVLTGLLSQQPAGPSSPSRLG